jgi:hypothetical protein
MSGAALLSANVARGSRLGPQRDERNLDAPDRLELEELDLDELELEPDELEELDDLELELDDELPLEELDDPELELDDELPLEELEEDDVLGREELLDPSSGEVGESPQATNEPTPTRTAPPLRIRRNSRRFSSREASSGCVSLLFLFFIVWVLHFHTATSSAVLVSEFRNCSAPPRKYVSIRRITSSAVIMSMHRGSPPTTSTQSSFGSSL